MLQLDVLAKTPVAAEPFPHLSASGLLDADSLGRIAPDFPRIEQPGIFPPETLSYGAEFARLLADIESPAIADILSEKFAVNLRNLPLMVTVRGQCAQRDGQIHTDSRDKVVTCLLYLNAPEWPSRGGCLRLLRNGHDLNDMIAEVPPIGGNFIAFRRTENSWHGHEPFIGPRRYIMFNWLRSPAALARNLGRHRLSAALKRFGIISGQ